MCSLGSRTPSEARALTASPRLPALARAIALLAGSNDPYLRTMLGLVHKALNCPDLNRVMNSRILEVAILPLRLLGATSLGRRRRATSKAPGLRLRASWATPFTSREKELLVSLVRDCMVPGGENISSGAISKKRLKSQSIDFTSFLSTFEVPQEAAGLAWPPPEGVQQVSRESESVLPFCSRVIRPVALVLPFKPLATAKAVVWEAKFVVPIGRNSGNL